MYQRNAVDPEEQARRQALSRVLTGTPSAPDAPMNAQEPIASGGPVRPDASYDAGNGVLSRQGNSGITGGMNKQLEPRQFDASLSSEGPGGFNGKLDQPGRSPWAGHPGEGAPDPTVPNAGLPDNAESERITVLPGSYKPGPGAGAGAGAARPTGAAFASEGFNPDKHGKDDPKYKFQSIAEQFDWKDPAQREAALQALKADPTGYFRNATLNGDILDVGANADPSFNGITRFDIQRDTENGGPLQWNPVDEGGGSSAGATPGTVPFDNGGSINGQTQPMSAGDSTYAKLIAMLQQQMGGGLDQQALERVLGGK